MICSRLRKTQETLLLLACARTDINSRKIQELAQRKLNWRTLLEQAEHYGVLPLVYTHLQQVVHSAQVPPDIMAEFKKLYASHIVRNIVFYDRLKEIIEALVHIPIIVLKGAALAELVYQDIKLRPMLDIDILVKKEDLDTVHNVLRKLNYIQDATYHSVEYYKNYHFHLAPYTNRDRSFVLEVHHHIISPTNPHRSAVFCSPRGITPTIGLIPIHDLWQRARPIQIASVKTLVFAPEDLLLHLVLHLLEDICSTGVGKLRGLCDIARTIRQYQDEIDWTQFLQEAHDYKVERHLYYAIWLTQELLASKIPIEVIENLKRSIRIRYFEDWLLKHILMTSVLRPHTVKSFIPLWIFYETCHELLSPKRMIDKITTLCKLILHGFVQSAQQTKPSLYYLAPLYIIFVHPFYLIVRSISKRF
jgi:hypothetical protein